MQFYQETAVRCAQVDWSLLSACRNFAPLASQNAPGEDSYQTAQMRRLIWILAVRTCSDIFSDVATQIVFLFWKLVRCTAAKDDPTICLSHMGRAMRKHVFGHMRTACLIRAVTVRLQIIGFYKMYKCPDETLCMRMMMWISTFCVFSKAHFRLTRFIYTGRQLQHVSNINRNTGLFLIKIFS